MARLMLSSQAGSWASSSRAARTAPVSAPVKTRISKSPGGGAAKPPGDGPREQFDGAPDVVELRNAQFGNGGDELSALLLVGAGRQRDIA
jgi:hypothetical protein